jgi:hypothetical protein
VTLLEDSRVITNYTRADKRIINLGIDVDQVEKATGRKVKRAKVVDAADASRSDRVIGNELLMFRPQVEKREKEPAPRAAEIPPRSDELSRRQEKERKKRAAEAAAQEARLDKEHRKEQQRLLQEQSRQRKLDQKQKKPVKPTAESSLERLRRQQKAERQAMNEYRQREAEVLRNRQETERKMARPQPTIPAPKRKKP